MTAISASKRKEDIVFDVLQKGYWIKPTGSRVTKSGWTEQSDWDYIVFDPDNELQMELNKTPGWELGGSERPEAEFSSWKKDGVNLILTNKKEFFDKYLAATAIIKLLDSKTKIERIKIFDSIFGTSSKNYMSPF